jgi:hypothetical protein
MLLSGHIVNLASPPPAWPQRQCDVSVSFPHSTEVTLVHPGKLRTATTSETRPQTLLPGEKDDPGGDAEKLFLWSSADEVSVRKTDSQYPCFAWYLWDVSGPVALA